MMKITKEWLEEKKACKKGIEWFDLQTEKDSIGLLKKLIKEKRYYWANWLIVRVMSYKQYVMYAVFSAEQVLYIYEAYNKTDTRPHMAIAAAKKCIKNRENAVGARAEAAWAAVEVAEAARAEEAAWAAAFAAEAAWAEAAEEAAEEAARAAEAAWAAVEVAEKETMQEKILKYGLKLLEVI